MSAGDPVFFWKTGRQGGLCGWGVIRKKPEVYEHIAKVEVRVWLVHPLTGSPSMLPPYHLWNRNRWATNFQLEQHEAKAVAAYFRERGMPEPDLDRVSWHTERRKSSAPGYSLSALERDVTPVLGPQGTVVQTLNLEARFDLHTTPEAATDPYTATQKDPRHVLLWFATNREPDPQAESIYGASRSKEGKIHYGQCTVNVPKGHKFGSTGSGWLTRWRKGDDRLTVERVTSLGETVFWNSLSKELTNDTESDKCMMLFVHGYRVTFKDAAIRTAQLAYDLKVPHASFFSWPSAGKTADYFADEASAANAIPRLSTYLKELESECVSSNIRLHVIAHSMGNRVLVPALIRLADQQWKPKALDKLVFASPDEDAETFTGALEELTAVGSRRTLYASSGDKPIWFSSKIHKNARAGILPPITIAKGLDTIDASNVDQTFLGHSDFASERPLLSDLFMLLGQGVAPALRASLKQAFDGPDIYWQLT